tara:strand:- start:91 stop:399 length:309 start_codon:yes stop_codon:yes gene_type:complete
LREELQETKIFNDEVRIETLEEEIDFLTKELSRAIGLGGRNRKARNPSEKACINVTRAIRTAIKRITEINPPAGDNLTRMVKTGILYPYNPDPLARIQWHTN